MDTKQAFEVFCHKGMWHKALELLRFLPYEDTLLFREMITDAIVRGKCRDILPLRDSYKLWAKERFEDFCIFHEWNREDKFYLPRKRGLKKVSDALQRLADGKTELLCISMPPGTGKTGLAIYYLAWLSGKNPELANLISSHNASFLRGVYDELLKEFTSDEYLWADLFGWKVVRTNAQDMKIDIKEPRRFSTIQLTSVGAGNAGKVRSQNVLYCDDLVESIEQAMSPERLEKLWQAYTVDLKQRKQGDCRELHISTRWSTGDIIGRLQVLNEDNPRAEFLSMPALNEKGESNFDYGGSIGFTKEFYEEIKASMDRFSFNALYMNEPIEREGLLYHKDELRRFYKLPDEQPDAIIGVCDTSEGKGDDTVLPVGYVYGNDHYIFDVVCSDALPEITDGFCANILTRNKVKACQFESNSAGGRTADKVNELVTEKGWKCNITKKRTTSYKETKIVVNSTWVKEHCLFLDDSVIPKGSQYSVFMKKLCSYTLKGRNKHDDVVDAMAQYALFTESFSAATVTVGKRYF